MTAPARAVVRLTRFWPLRPCTRLPACRPVIGDALLLQYPQVAKALAEGQPQRGGRQVPRSAKAANTQYPISRLPSEVRAFIEVDQECGCWVWQQTNCDGYGYVPAAIRHGNPESKAHRFVYTELVGPIPPGFTLDHVRARGCLFKACCWPTHLQPVTHAENSRRGAADRHGGRYDAALAARVHPLITEGLSSADIHRRTGIGWKIIADVAAAAEGGAE
jgi:hypothetical protein